MNTINFTDKSWIKIDTDSDFSLQNIPFGVGMIAGIPKVCTRLGDDVVDLDALAGLDVFKTSGLDTSTLKSPSLNAFIGQGKKITVPFREELIKLFHHSDPEKLADRSATFLFDVNEVPMVLPIEIGDYTDFYSSREHATNVGTMFRDPDNALMPNWLHLPVGYHGRASSIVVSGTDIRRPNGQTRPDPEQPAVFGPSRLMDFELEMAFVVGKNNPLGTSVDVSKAEDHIFGLTLFNDWSARDIQKWEYVPLGPFLAKNFASTMSPWLVTLEALEPFSVKSPEQNPEVLPYLQNPNNRSFDLHLFVDIILPNGETTTVCRSNYKYMYWSMAQQLAHHTVNGCNMKVGDVCASGTISGRTEDSYGSMLELSWQGTRPLPMPDGSQRKFIHNGDTINMRAFGEKEGVRVGFGDCKGTVVE